MDWRPAASLDTLRRRAGLLAEIRAFFAGRGVLEVETPIVCRYGVTSPHLHNERLATAPDAPPRFLQTSPEYAMKRLLAAGSGSIYQVSRAFRHGEQGTLHNPEFSLLEWYRTGFDHHRMMDEIDELLAALLALPDARRRTYAEVFDAYLRVDVDTAAHAQLAAETRSLGLDPAAAAGLDRDGLLDFLFSAAIQPRLGRDAPEFVHAYPASQADLARIAATQPATAARFELFIDGIELANGYHELSDPDELRRRFARDRAARRDRGLPEREDDAYLLAALQAGLPDCAGVALGLDRLLMLACGEPDIRRVLAFPADIA